MASAKVHLPSQLSSAVAVALRPFRSSTEPLTRRHVSPTDLVTACPILSLRRPGYRSYYRHLRVILIHHQDESRSSSDWLPLSNQILSTVFGTPVPYQRSLPYRALPTFLSHSRIQSREPALLRRQGIRSQHWQPYPLERVVIISLNPPQYRAMT